MKIYKEIKEIAKCVAKINRMVEKLQDEGFDIEGIAWITAQFVALDKEDIENFKYTNGVTEDYFVSQSCGYLGDDYSGHLYFKTSVPGQYVRVYFEC